LVVFTSNRTKKKSKKYDYVTGEGYTNLFLAKYTNEIVRKNKKGKKRTVISEKYSWVRPELLSDSLNSPFNEGATCFSADGNTMYFSSTRKLNKQLYGSKIYSVAKNGDEWGEIKILPLVADSISIGHPSLSADGDTMYFVSDMPGGYGGNDIWMSQKDGSEWGSPVNLGKEVNTKGNELFPHIRENGVLYFSSDAHEGIGGLDIFMATTDENDIINVESLKWPINSSADDYAICFQQNENKGLFSSSRNRGVDNIFRFKYMSIRHIYKLLVLNDDTEGPLKEAKIELTDSNGNQKNYFTNENGILNIEIDANTDYIGLISQKEFLNSKDAFSTVGLKGNKTFKNTVRLKPIEKPIELPNILYDFASYELRNESKTALDGLVATLNDNPKITIELGSHTDYVGSDDSNKDLSQKRAQAVVDYLVSKDINWDRMKAVGYGESAPQLVDAKLAAKYDFLKEGDILKKAKISRFKKDQIEVANQINRRTDFRVLSTDYVEGPNSKMKPGDGLNQIGKALIKDIAKIKGKIYTVQLGVFNKTTIPRSLENFKVVFRENADKDTYRYSTGIYDDYNLAKKRAAAISKTGIKAFVIVYYNGKKITFDQAKKIK